jgi:hypothetical protein
LVAFQSLTYLAPYVTAPSVLPLEVVPPAMVPINELTRSSSGELSVPVSEALGISLSEVHDMYFGNRSENERVCIVEEAQEHCREEHNYVEDRRWMDSEEHC